MPSDGYIAVKKQLKKLQKETDKMIELLKTFNYRDSRNSETTIDYYHQNFSDEFIDKYLREIQECEIRSLCKTKPQFDFTYLENDIILSTIEGGSIDEIVQTALIKYKI